MQPSRQKHINVIKLKKTFGFWFGDDPPEHRFEFTGTVAIRHRASRHRRAIPGGITGVHLCRLLENFNGGLGDVLQ